MKPATAIIQARMGSTRLPGKVLKPLAGHPMLWHVVRRVAVAPGIGQVVIATTDRSENDAVREFCAASGVPVFSGSEDDVLDRYYQAARTFSGDPVVRVTSDCPLVDPGLIGRLLAFYGDGAYDYVGIAIGGGARATGVQGYPDGLDAECFSFAALEAAWQEASDQADREHVTPYLYRRPSRFRCGSITSDKDLTDLRLTVDQPEDFALAERIYEALYREDAAPFSLEDVLTVLAEHPDWAGLNSGFVGREKYRDLWTPVGEHGETGSAVP